MKILFTFLLLFTEVSFAQKQALECKEDPVQEAKSCALKNEAPAAAILSDAEAIKKECEKKSVSLEFARAAIGMGAASSKVPTEDKLKQDIVFWKDIIKNFNTFIENLKPFMENFDEAKKSAEAESVAKIIASEEMNSALKIESDPEKKNKILADFKKKYPSQFFYIPSSKIDVANNVEESKQKIQNFEIKIAEAEAKIAELIAAKAKGELSEDEKVINMVNLSLTQNNQHIKQNSKFRDCGLTDEELAAINWYSGPHFQAINQALRSNDPERLKKFQPIINAVNSGLEKLKPVTYVVKRGVHLPPEVASKHCLGCEVVYDSFTSTSAEKGFPSTSMFVIKSKKGRYIAPISPHHSEEEVLFKSGTKFKVLNVEKTIEGATHYTMEEVD